MRRFFAKTRLDPETGCLLWTASVGKTSGHGRFRVDYVEHGAHRYAYFLSHGTWPEFVCHTCDNRLCVNADHLFAGGPQANVDDMMQKGRNIAPSGERNGMTKLSDEQRAQIRELRSRGANISQLARQFNVFRSTIHYVLRT